MSFRSGSTYYREFVITDGSRQAVDPDDTPSATANRNGVDDSAFVLVVTRLGLGRLSVSGTVPTSYANGDAVGVSVAYAVQLAPFVVAVETFVLDDKSGYALASSGLDAIEVENGVNARQALSPMAALSGGVLSGASTGQIVIKALGNPTITRITATTDANGNRPSVILTLPT